MQGSVLCVRPAYQICLVLHTGDDVSFQTARILAICKSTAVEGSGETSSEAKYCKIVVVRNKLKIHLRIFIQYMCGVDGYTAPSSGPPPFTSDSRVS